MAAMNTVCQKCGDKGDSKLFVFCIQCQTSAEHRYCLDKLPKDGHEEVIWTCHECTPKDVKLPPSPLRKSQRISLIKKRAEARKNMRKPRSRREVPVILTHANTDRLAEATQLTCGFSNPNEKITKLPSREAPDIHTQANTDRLAEATRLTCEFSNPNERITKFPSSSENCGSQEFKRQRRRLILPEEGSSDEMSEPEKLAASQSTSDSLNDPPNNFCSKASLEYIYYVPAQPVSDRIWRGCFNIRNQRRGIIVKLAAHLSSKACSKVVDAASLLPPVLDLEILPKADAWPKSFNTLPPTDDSIALYFLPEYEKDENDFDMLLDDMINDDFAIKTLVDNVELLVFSSRELPTEHWRLERKYYLWAVFRQRQDLFSLKPTQLVPIQNSNAECITPLKLTDDGGNRRERDLAKTESSFELAESFKHDALLCT